MAGLTEIDDFEVVYTDLNAFSFPLVVGIGRLLVIRQRVLFKFVQNNLHGFFQLRIVSSAPELRIIFYFDIRGDTPVLDFPVAGQSVNRPAGCCDGATVHQLG